MVESRIDQHPVLPIPERERIGFYWGDTYLQARRGEVITTALIANGINIFGIHAHDNSAQGIFCANGQCSRCMVIADGVPVKGCMTPVRPDMKVEKLSGLPTLPDRSGAPLFQPVTEKHIDVLIIGAGPAGLSAALELGKLNIPTLVIDDKDEAGGKLVLQTHKFFGSVEDSRAGTRGNHIGKILADELKKMPTVDLWLSSTAIYVYKDKKVGILKGKEYQLITPKVLINAAGAREKFIRFPGNQLVGIYGAGAFQTLVNRDLVRPAKRIFVVGGGNVGLIAAYHALQAGIQVAGLVEAISSCGGYKVHSDKLQRLGVPIYTSHSILSANGAERVESVTIAQLDAKFRFLPGTEKTVKCDTILIAVGLDSINEFAHEAETAGIPVFPAGDAAEIAEASSAMFNGRIAGLKVAKSLGAAVDEIPEVWMQKAEVLKSHPGKTIEQEFPSGTEGVMPIIHCLQEIPCNPCITVCPTQSIHIPGEPLLGQPRYNGSCIGCGKCVTICPGLAITLVDFRKDPAFPEVTVPYELSNFPIQKGDPVNVVSINGSDLGMATVTQVIQDKKSLTQLIRMKVPADRAKRVVSFRIQDVQVSAPLKTAIIPEKTCDDALVCLCERVSVGEIRALIRQGVTDMNQIKAVTRAGMGSCGAKTCDTLIKQVFREEGIPPQTITPNTKRPVFVEIPLGILAGQEGAEE